MTGLRKQIVTITSPLFLSVGILAGASENETEVFFSAENYEGR